MFIEYDDLIRKIEASSKNYNVDLISKAYKLANDAHKGQFRSSGEPYVTHPVTVAGILVDMGMDTESIIAAILHDVVEDTNITIMDIKNMFSETVSKLVDGVTKLGKIPFSTKEERQAENVRKMLFAMTQDIRVIIIKLCDRLHNMRTLSARPFHKKMAKSKETMEVYAPIAHRLGITAMKEELEDISISYLDSYGYSDIESLLNLHKKDRDNIIDEIVNKLKAKMDKSGEEAYIYGRVKSIYGIYRKMYIQCKDFDDIYDIYAVRIIVNSITQCYNSLGVMHDMFTPIPNKFKDYISLPKQNGYQSLHTTVVSKNSIPFEIQIRTWDMHHTAEYGVAAHWKYKEGIKKDRLQDSVSWVRQLLESQTETSDCIDILNTIKSDIASEDVFVFTPDGDVKSLPVGSTVIDFAYAIHSEIGNSMVGAKVDGKIVPIYYKVSTGEIIEIITSKAHNKGPSRDWLQVVKTSEARNKIKSWYKKEKREENILIGKHSLDKGLKRNYININGKERDDFILNSATRQKYVNIDDFYAAIGYGEINLSTILQKLKDEYSIGDQNDDKKEKYLDGNLNFDANINKIKSGVIIDSVENCSIKFAKCCTPLPGDDIIGFITKGYGVSIHKVDCSNIKKQDPHRLVSANWNNYKKSSYKATILVKSIDRNSLVADVTISLSSMKITIYNLNARVLKNGYFEIQVTIGINDVRHLDAIMERIKKIKNVETVSRVINKGG